MTDLNDDKRRFSRVAFDADVLITKDDKEWRSKLVDISLKGALVETPNNWDAVNGEKFNFEVIFADSGSLINAEVSVAHSSENGVGFQIIHIDVESVSHLRRLIELNLGDTELLNRELTALLWK